MDGSEVSALPVLYLVGVSAFAVSGVLAAHRAQLDAFGGVVLAFICALAGGTVREVLLDRHPLYWTRDPLLLGVVLGVALLAMVWLRYGSVPRRTLLVVDALGLAVVTVIGAEAAIEVGVTPLAVVILAVITGVTGELIRDLIVGEVPPLLLREEIYATAALAGAALYLLLSTLGVGPGPNAAVCVAVVFGLRMIAVRFHLRLPRPAARS